MLVSHRHAEAAPLEPDRVPRQAGARTVDLKDGLLASRGSAPDPRSACACRGLDLALSGLSGNDGKLGIRAEQFLGASASSLDTHRARMPERYILNGSTQDYLDRERPPAGLILRHDASSGWRRRVRQSSGSSSARRDTTLFRLLCDAPAAHRSQQRQTCSPTPSQPRSCAIRPPCRIGLTEELTRSKTNSKSLNIYRGFTIKPSTDGQSGHHAQVRHGARPGCWVAIYTQTTPRRWIGLQRSSLRGRSASQQSSNKSALSSSARQGAEAKSLFGNTFMRAFVR